MRHYKNPRVVVIGLGLLAGSCVLFGINPKWGFSLAVITGLIWIINYPEIEG